jgi:hypothetical protein
VSVTAAASGDGGHVRASDGDREAVAGRLATALGEGRIGLADYTDRVGAAYAATTIGELASLTVDLPRSGPPAPVPQPGGVERVRALLGNASRSGEWEVPEYLEVRSVLGDCHIELQRARLRHPVTTIRATAVLGSVTVFVPEGVDVRLSGDAVLGSRSCSVASRPRPGAPIVRVECVAVLGSVSVRPPKCWEPGGRLSARWSNR